MLFDPPCQPFEFLSNRLTSSAALTLGCLWAWSEVIACFVTFPCKLRLMAPINFQGSWNCSVRWWLWHLTLFYSHSDKDNCSKLALGYWLLKFNRRANDKVVACLEMTLQSAKIRHTLTVVTLLTTSVVWHCASCSQLSMRLHNSVPLRRKRSPDVARCRADNHMVQPERCFGTSVVHTKILSFNTTGGSVQLRQGLGNLMHLLP